MPGSMLAICVVNRSGAADTPLRRYAVRLLGSTPLRRYTIPPIRPYAVTLISRYADKPLR